MRFDENVTGVDATDFATTVDELYGTSVTGVSGSGDDYTVTVNTGNGAGTLRLDLRDNDSIFDADRNPLGGIGVDNGHFTAGEIYQVIRDPGMNVRSLKNSADVSPGGHVKVQWTSGPIGSKVRIELWRNGQRVAVLLSKTNNDGSQKVTVPGSVSYGGGYTIRVVSITNPALFTDMKKPFAIE